LHKRKGAKAGNLSRAFIIARNHTAANRQPLTDNFPSFFTFFLKTFGNLFFCHIFAAVLLFNYNKQ
jgi:hypothetical protein